jgi:hypothetical protein
MRCARGTHDFNILLHHLGHVFGLGRVVAMEHKGRASELTLQPQVLVSELAQLFHGHVRCLRGATKDKANPRHTASALALGQGLEVGEEVLDFRFPQLGTHSVANGKKILVCWDSANFNNGEAGHGERKKTAQWSFKCLCSVIIVSNATLHSSIGQTKGFARRRPPP